MKKFLSFLGMSALLVMGTMATPVDASAQSRYRMVKTTTTNNSIDTINTATSTYFNGIPMNNNKAMTIKVDVTKYSGTVDIKAVLYASNDALSTHLFMPMDPETGGYVSTGDTLVFGDATGTQVKGWNVPATAQNWRDYQVRLISTGTLGTTVKLWQDSK